MVVPPRPRLGGHGTLTGMRIEVVRMCPMVHPPRESMATRMKASVVIRKRATAMGKKEFIIW